MRDADHERVAGRFGDGAVELEVGDAEADRVGEELLLHGDDRGEAGEVLVGEELGREPRDAAVDHHAGLVERLDILGVEGDQHLKRAEEIGRVERGDIGAAALAGVDHAEDLKTAERLAHARPAHLQHLRQVALGRELVARLEVAGPHQVEDLLRHLVGDRVRSTGEMTWATSVMEALRPRAGGSRDAREPLVLRCERARPRRTRLRGRALEGASEAGCEDG